MSKTTPASRLKWLRKQLGLTLQDMGDRIGVSVSGVQKWESGASELAEVACRALEQAFNARWEWLLRGEEPIWKDQAAAPPNDYQCPLIEGTPTCGPGGELQDPGPSAPRYSFRRDAAMRMLRASGGGQATDLFFARAAGDSMHPTIRDGEIIALNASHGARTEIKNYAIYLVRSGPNSSSGMVKRVRLDPDGSRLALLSDNPFFLPHELELDGVQLHQLILARVCWVGRYLYDSEPPQFGR